MKDEAKEIMQGLSVEEMTAMYFANSLKEPDYKVYQLNSKGHRYYYRFNEDGTPEFFPSVTTIISQTMPTPPHLVKWIADMGYDEAEAYKTERAYYGTFMHAAFEELIINRAYDLDALKDKLKEYIEQNNLPAGFIHHADELKKDVLAFAQFVIDYDVRPLAVEISLVHPTYRFAGMIDLPCTMRKKQSSEERIAAIVDFKSGRKGFHEDYEVQLHLYKMLWEANYQEIPIERVYNFSPKDWRKKPTYNLKDQTESESAKKVPHLLALAAIEDDKRENTFTAVSGQINLNADALDLAENVTTLSLSELIMAKAPKEDAPSDENDATPTENEENGDLNASNHESGTSYHTEEKKPLDGKNEENNLLATIDL